MCLNKVKHGKEPAMWKQTGEHQGELQPLSDLCNKDAEGKHSL